MAEEPEPGRPGAPRPTVADRYQLQQLIGRGGMSLVYRVLDTDTGETAAIKLLRPEMSGSDRLEYRFAAEGVAMLLLRHPNVAHIRDMGVDHATGTSFIVMAWAERGSASDQLKSRGPLPARTVAAWGLELLCALGAAHARGIVHRDVKPGNVLIDREGHALLTDFGVAIAPDTGLEVEPGTSLLGSYAYMAPEQRVRSGAATARSDLYGVAATLFNLLTGESPVDLFLTNPDDPRWDAVPPGLRALLRRATAWDPAHRPTDARDMARELAAACPEARQDTAPHVTAWLDGD